MRLDRLTNKFQLAISDAQSMALGRDHQYIEPVHVMMALLNQENGSIRSILATLNLNTHQIRSTITEAIEQLPVVSGAGADVQISSQLVNLLNLSDKLSQKRKDKYVTSEIFLLAAVSGQGKLTDILQKLGLSEKNVSDAIDTIRDGQNVEEQNAEDLRQALEKYTTDLTERAEQGRLDPVIGRDDEIRRTIQCFSGEQKTTQYLLANQESVKLRLLKDCLAHCQW